MSKDPRTAAGSGKGVSVHSDDSFSFAHLSWLVFIETLRRCGNAQLEAVT